jgi:hypothetical protein
MFIHTLYIYIHIHTDKDRGLTDKRQTRPLVREGAHMDKTVTFMKLK